MSEIYEAPLAIGTRVRLIREEGYSGVEKGTLGTITWKHPWPETPYRVKWDGFEDDYMPFGMDDIGWLMAPEEVEAVE